MRRAKNAFRSLKGRPMAALDGELGVTSLEVATLFGNEHKEIVDVINEVNWAGASVTGPVPCTIDYPGTKRISGFLLSQGALDIMSEIFCFTAVASIVIDGVTVYAVPSCADQHRHQCLVE